MVEKIGIESAKIIDLFKEHGIILRYLLIRKMKIWFMFLVHLLCDQLMAERHGKHFQEHMVIIMIYGLMRIILKIFALQMMEVQP